MATPLDNAVGLTGNSLIDGLLQGSAWQFGGGSHVLTYSLSLNDNPNGGPWTSPLTTAIRQAFTEWSNVANVTFVETGNGTVFTQSSAELAIALVGGDLSPASGLGVFPSPSFADSLYSITVNPNLPPDTPYDRSTYPHPEGDVFLGNDPALPVYDFVTAGGLGFEFMLHEIGHALGLKHPFDDGGNNRPTFAQLGIAGSDNAAYTVMSYNQAAGASMAAGNAATPMPLDILAIQQIYGANTSFHTGDDVYQLTDAVRTIWDAGGNDTIDASSNGSGVSIDLRPGAYTLAGGTDQPVAILGIAYNVTIENAIGNDFNNTIIGNDADNRIDGRGGVDQMQGGKGNDTYIINGGLDLVVENPGEGVDTVLSSASYILAANVENLTLTGSSRIDGTGNELDNVIVGNDAINNLVGGAGNDYVDGRGGVDVMMGGLGDDTYVVADVTPPLPATLIRVHGDSGDFITAGQSYLLTPSDGNFSVSASDLNHDGFVDTVTAQFSGTSGPDGIAILDFSTWQTGQNIVADTTYTDAMRYPFEAAGHPGLWFFLDARGTGSVTGSFSVVNAQFDTSGPFPVVLSFSVNFEQHADGNAAAAYGTFNYNFGGGEGGGNPEVIVELPGEGTDTVLSSIAYALPANVENLTLTGSSSITGTGNTLDNVLTGNDAGNLLSGDAGNDTLSGGFGIDSLAGGPGDDTEVVSASAMGGPSGIVFVPDAVSENLNDGIDTVFSDSSYTLSANIENLVLTGAPFWHAYTGTGNGLDNVITGQGSARHILDGGAGNDTLVGGTGIDTLSGGTGSDVFLMNSAPSADKVLDFTSGADHIDLDKAIYMAFGTTGAVSASNVQIGLESAIGAGSGNSGDGQDYLKYATDTGHLYYDADGTAAGGLSLIATLHSSGSTPAALLPTQDILIV